MGKSSAPAAPDYKPIAASDQAIADQQFQMGKDQLQWSKDQFNTVWPYAQQYMDQQTKSSAAETASAKDQQDFYDTTYKPIEGQFADEATNYNSQGRSDQRAAGAMGDVTSAYDANRTAALSNLESYGIDPSQTRYQALDLGTRISQAAATAGAATQSRLNSEATGMALQGEAINVGRGYASSIANSYNTATNSGSSGINSANSTIGTGSSAMQGSTSFTNAGLNANQGAVGALHSGFQDQMAGAQFNAQQSQQFSQGMGSLIGGGLAMAMMM